MTKAASRIVTFIAVGVLIFGLVQLVQAVAIGARSSTAISYGADSTQLMVRAILAIVWACIFFWQAFQLYRHRESSLTLLPLGIIVVIYLLYQLVLASFSASAIDQQRWLILAIAVGCAIVLGWFAQWRIGRSAGES